MSEQDEYEKIAKNLNSLKILIENYTKEDDEFICLIKDKSKIVRCVSNVSDFDIVDALDSFVRNLRQGQLDNIFAKLQHLVDNWPCNEEGIEFPDGDFIAKTKKEIRH